MANAKLRAFVALADTGSVRAAADRLVVSEPAVSAAIAALTREVGVPLTARVGRGIRLTPSGEVYAGYARRVLGLLDQGAAAARGELAPDQGEIRLAAVTTAADHVLPAWLAGFRRRYPQVGLHLEVANKDRVWALLEAHEVHLAIAGRPPTAGDAAVRAVRSNTLVIVASAEVARGFTPATATWLLREPGSGARSTCESLLTGLEIDPPRLTLGSNGAVVAGAVAGLGVSLVSHDAVADELAADRLVTVEMPGVPLSRPWHAVSHRQSTATTLLAVDDLVRHGGGWRFAGADTAAPRHWTAGEAGT
ncbi:LysR family transcriptional regulator [Allosalinactinospora lopnorensis]|uniref:LysR family transcriptional regulator n=1 Tax=Allosalinactinospora lopnorensis TaxID=1352348 RepID=UPI000623E29F|nr:LysR substrate-binding domain-containing protein [Allosalinactinospora lopnorensis]